MKLGQRPRRRNRDRGKRPDQHRRLKILAEILHKKLVFRKRPFRVLQTQPDSPSEHSPLRIDNFRRDPDPVDDLFADRIGNRCGNPDIPFRRTRNLRNALFLLLGILVLDHDVAVTECPDGEQKKKDHQCRKKKNNSVFHRVSDSL